MFAMNAFNYRLFFIFIEAKTLAKEVIAYVVRFKSCRINAR